MMLKILNTDLVVQNAHEFLYQLSRATNLNTAIIKEHAMKVVSNEKGVASCVRKINSLKTKACTTLTSEVIIDNIPKELLKGLTENLPDDTRSAIDLITKKILNLMNIQHMNNEILEIADFPRKGQDRESFSSIRVKFKSPTIRDYVLEKKRIFGKIELAKLFASWESEHTIYMNELLPSSIFKLHMEARRRKKETGWDGAIFVRSNNIFGRDNLTNTLFCILDEDDLNKIT